MVGMPLQGDFDAMSEDRNVPVTPAPSELPTVSLMQQDPIPRGINAIPSFNNRLEDFEIWRL